MPDRSRPGDGVLSPARPPLGPIAPGWFDRPDDLPADGFGAVAGEPASPARPEHDPDVDPVARNGGDPDVAVAQDDHPGIPRGCAGWIVEVEREPDPPGERGRPADPDRACHDRPDTVGPDDDPRAQPRGFRQLALRTRPEGLDPQRAVGSPGQLDPTDRYAGPDVGTSGRGERQERRVEPLAIETDGGRAERAIVPIGQPEPHAAPRLDPHRRGRPGDLAEDVLGEPDPTEDRHGRRRGEHATGVPAIGGRALEEDDLATGPGEQRRDRRAGQPATDDGDVDDLAHRLAARIAAIA